MNRIDKKFKELKEKSKKAFIAYITAGDPSLRMTGEVVCALERSGADIVELGIPFSDPVADGPTIQAASERALKKGVNLKKIFNMVSVLRRKSGIPIVFMTYYNPVMQYGVREFFAGCKENGVDGVIIPDLPVEESGDVVRFGRRYKIATIFLAAPTSGRKRIAYIAKYSKGFIYYVSLTGVTGARRSLPGELSSKVRKIKSLTGMPVAVGFGVSTAAQAKGVAGMADGVIVGSAIVKIIGEGKDIISRVSDFAGRLAKAVHDA